MGTRDPRKDDLYDAWREVTADHPTGPNYDLTESNRTGTCVRRLDSFVAEPSEDSFHELWHEDCLYAYLTPNPTVALGSWDGSFDELATFLETVATSDDYDDTWERRFPWVEALWELYGRTHVETTPIPSAQARGALRSLGFETGGSFEAGADSLESFREELEAATHRDPPSGVDRWVEVDELLRLISATDRETINAELTGPRGRLYRALIGYAGPAGGTGRSLDLDVPALEWAVSSHLDALEEGAYEDTTTEHWGGTHVESWKWGYRDHFEETVRKQFDLDALESDDVEPFFEALEWGDEHVGSVPSHMMGRWGASDWTYLGDHFVENPENGAEVLSLLFSEDEHVTTRLGTLRNFTAPTDVSPGNLQRFATMLLMYAFPDSYVAFQYQRFSAFFDAFTPADGLDTGYDPEQYWQVVLACRSMRDVLAERMNGRSMNDHPMDDSSVGGPSMLDVHTLIYVWNDVENPPE